MREPSDLV
uniref:Uncharacterized protein n=1 Tax=Anguilla anguilla TaxID=7936 RepID=A0A0E9V724_ANGAN